MTVRARAIAWVITSLVWLGLLTINAFITTLTIWGNIASVLAAVLGIGAFFALIAWEEAYLWARGLLFVGAAGLILMAGLNMFGNIYCPPIVGEQSEVILVSDQQFQADQTAAQFYYTEGFTIRPTEETDAIYTQPTCMASDDPQPTSVHLWNGELMPSGAIENTSGICKLTIDISSNFVTIKPTRNEVNALDSLDYPDDGKISTLTVTFPVDVEVAVFLYDPELAKTQGTSPLPEEISVHGLCNGCSTTPATYLTN